MEANLVVETNDVGIDGQVDPASRGEEFDVVSGSPRRRRHQIRNLGQKIPLIDPRDGQSRRVLDRYAVSATIRRRKDRAPRLGAEAPQDTRILVTGCLISGIDDLSLVATARRISPGRHQLVDAVAQPPRRRIGDVCPAIDEPDGEMAGGHHQAPVLDHDVGRERPRPVDGFGERDDRKWFAGVELREREAEGDRPDQMSVDELDRPRCAFGNIRNRGDRQPAGSGQRRAGYPNGHATFEGSDFVEFSGRNLHSVGTVENGAPRDDEHERKNKRQRCSRGLQDWQTMALITHPRTLAHPSSTVFEPRSRRGRCARCGRACGVGDNEAVATEREGVDRW